MSQSADAGQREVAFRIFTTTPGIIEKQHEAAVQEVFGKGFKDSNVEVGFGFDAETRQLMCDIGQACFY